MLGRPACSEFGARNLTRLPKVPGRCGAEDRAGASGRERLPLDPCGMAIGAGQDDDLGAPAGWTARAFHRLPLLLQAPGNLARKIVDPVSGATF